LRVQAQCPAVCALIMVYRLVGDIVQHLNDYHKWTRDRIVGWLREIEREWESEREAGYVAPESGEGEFALVSAGVCPEGGG
jgi:hypothetical protein